MLWASDSPTEWSEVLRAYPDCISAHKPGMAALDKYAQRHCLLKNRRQTGC